MLNRLLKMGRGSKKSKEGKSNPCTIPETMQHSHFKCKKENHRKHLIFRLEINMRWNERKRIRRKREGWKTIIIIHYITVYNSKAIKNFATAAYLNSIIVYANFNCSYLIILPIVMVFTRDTSFAIKNVNFNLFII